MAVSVHRAGRNVEEPFGFENLVARESEWVVSSQTRTEKDVRAEVCRRVELFLQNDANSILDLSNVGLTETPPFLDHSLLVDRIKELDLSGNLFVELSRNICFLSALEKLNLSNNPHLRSLPEDFGNLKGLKELDLFQTVDANDELLELRLPESFRDLSGLLFLVLAGYNFDNVPDVIYGCMNLRELDIMNTHLTRVPDELCRRLSNLTKLDLAANFISIISDQILYLHHLKELNLSTNPIKTIPDVLFNLSSICRVNLKETELTDDQKQSIDQKVNAEDYHGPAIEYFGAESDSEISSSEGVRESDSDESAELGGDDEKSNQVVPSSKRAKTV